MGGELAGDDGGERGVGRGDLIVGGGRLTIGGDVDGCGVACAQRDDESHLMVTSTAVTMA